MNDLSIKRRATEIACIQATKAYDQCSVRRCVRVDASLQHGDYEYNPDRGCGTVRELLSCRFDRSSLLTECAPEQVGTDPPLVRITVSYAYEVVVTFRSGSGNVCTTRIIRTGMLSAVLFGTAQNDCKVDVYPRCLGCDIVNKRQLSCEVGELIVLQTVADVQLLVPSFGFCPTEECVKRDRGQPHAFSARADTLWRDGPGSESR